MYLCRLWIDSIKDLSCDNKRGGLNASIGVVFQTNGVMPVGVILCPSHSHSRCANLPLDNCNVIFSWSSFFSIFSAVEICSIPDPLVVMSISSKKTCACGNSDSMQSNTL